MSYLPLLSKKLRFVALAIVLCYMLWFLAAEILIRGMEAIRASSRTVLPTLSLNWFTCMLRACCMISLTRVLLNSSAFIASSLDTNSFLPQLMPLRVKSIFRRAYLPIGSSAESIPLSTYKSSILAARFVSVPDNLLLFYPELAKVPAVFSAREGRY